MSPTRLRWPPTCETARAGGPGKRCARSRPCLERLEDRSVPSAFEVWAVDQSNTRDGNGDGTLDSGGTLYVYQGRDLTGRHAAQAAPDVIDLGGEAFHDYLFAATGEAGVRPHMLTFNSARTHAVLAYVASGHVLFIDAATRRPVGVVDVDPQAHAAFPAPDDSYVIVANQNGKTLHRIFTDYDNNVFTLDPVALDLAALEGPGRPNNRPICPVITSDSRLTFVTLAGGGMFVVRTEPSAPMTVVADYTNDVVHNDGCGGSEVNGKVYINAGGAGHHDLYAFSLADFDDVPNPPNLPVPTLVYTRDGAPATTQADAHGMALTRHGRYLWVADRWANRVVVVDTNSDTVVNEIPLTGAVSSDPAPDLMAAAPSGNRVFATFRGPNPLTGNNAAFSNAVGNTPGVGVIQVTAGGRDGRLKAVAPISHVVAGVERADPHAIAVLEVPRGRHLHAVPADAAGARPGGGAADNRPAVHRLLGEASPRRAAAGADTSALDVVRIRVADLGGTALGLVSGQTIWLDDNAAGWGWFVDRTPRSDSEFTRPGNQGEQGHMDLLTVLVHEVGHRLGYDHEPSRVMAEALAAGIRTTPGCVAPVGLGSSPETSGPCDRVR